MAARFDLLSTLFVLLSLITFLHYVRRGSYWLIPLLAFCLLAELSKEAAYCLPLLILCLVVNADKLSRRRKLIATAGTAAVSTGLFVYRLFLMGGIGGYRTNNGKAMILQVSPLRTAKALLYREWALLFFPINWSSSLGIWITVALAGYLFVLLLGTWSLTVSRTYLWSALGLIFCASLPVQHLLLLGPDLSGARVLYLPTIGFCFLVAIALDAARAHQAAACVGMFLLFHAIVLQHNLYIWDAVATKGRQTCEAIGRAVQSSGKDVEVAGLPAQLHGVFFVRNALPMCVHFTSGEDPKRVSEVDASTRPDQKKLRLVWNSITETVEPQP